MQFTSDYQPENRGRKKGVPTTLTKQIKSIFERLINHFTDEDLIEIYNEMKKDKKLFIQFLKTIAPRNLTIETESNPIALITKEQLKDFESDVLFFDH